MRGKRFRLIAAKMSESTNAAAPIGSQCHGEWQLSTHFLTFAAYVRVRPKSLPGRSHSARDWGVRASNLAFAAVLALPSAALAGPPFLTDDPEPTDLHHWEIYAPLLEISGKGANYEGSLEGEFNYGAAPGVQITMGVPFAYAHDQAGMHSGLGDLEFSVKYRFYHDGAGGVSIAAFPGVTLPTATHGLGSDHVTALLPVWGQKDFDDWSVFGGGGYSINPGRGNRDFWTGGVALTRKFSDALLVGIEVDREGADTVDGRASTSLGMGAILQVPKPFRILASGGPTFVDGSGAAEFHGFLALGLDF